MRAFRLASLMLVLLSGFGCDHFMVRTDNRVKIDGPVETRVDIPPVPQAGPVRAIDVTPCGPGPRIALVDVDGLILNSPFTGPLSVGENPVAVFREKLDAIEADSNVKAVVLRINSPGGGISACASMRADLERFKTRKHVPIVACLLDTGAGGAYYLASAADQVVAGPATVTGGIGVILNLFNLRDLMAQYNVIPQPIRAGVNIDIGTSARALTQDEKDLLQAMANEFHDKLKADVSRSRPGIDLDGGKTFDGRIFTGNQAKAKGLVDLVADLDTAIQWAANLSAGTQLSERPHVVLYRRTNDPAHSIYAVTANVPLQGAGLLPNLPGLDRAKLPTFLSVWQPELTMEKLGGK